MRIWTNTVSCNCNGRGLCMPAMKRLQESRTVETSVYGLTRGVGLTTHSYSIVRNLTPLYKKADELKPGSDRRSY